MPGRSDAITIIGSLANQPSRLKTRRAIRSRSSFAPGGVIVKGAQGSFPFGPALAQGAAFPWFAWQSLFDVPWLHPDPLDRSNPCLTSRFEYCLPQDLIGVRDRHYLDRTGLQQQRSIVDLMRYAALNQGGDALASFDGFIPADIPKFKTLPEPTNVGAATATSSFMHSRSTSIPSSHRQTRTNSTHRQRAARRSSRAKDAPPVTRRLSIPTTNSLPRKASRSRPTPARSMRYCPSPLAPTPTSPSRPGEEPATTKCLPSRASGTATCSVTVGGAPL
jgi:hypothetical protein